MRCIQGTTRLAAVIVGLLALNLPAEDWPHWRGPSHNGISKESAWSRTWPGDGPAIAWRAHVGTGFSSVSVSGGRLFTLGNREGRESVLAFDAKSGRELWRHSYDCPIDPNLFEGGPTSTPTVDGSRVYSISRQGHLFCFEAGTGRIVWSRHLAEDTEMPSPSWGFAGSPLVLGDRLLLNVGEMGLALDKSDGATLWASNPSECGYSTPVPFRHQGRDYAVMSSSRFYSAVDVGTGEPLWRLRWITRFGINASDPIIAGERGFVSTGYRKGAILFDWTEGLEPEQLWKSKELKTQLNPAVLFDNHLYGVNGDTTEDATLKCLAFETGEPQWEAEGIGSGAVTIADGHLIVITDKGELIIAPADPKAFKPTAKARVLSGKCWTVPVLANGMIYCRNAAGEIAAVDLRE